MRLHSEKTQTVVYTYVSTVTGFLYVQREEIKKKTYAILKRATHSSQKPEPTYVYLFFFSPYI